MKLLRITLPNGHKMLEEGFTVDFLTKTRVDKDTENPDLFSLFEGFYYPIETVFIGKNSSGKTTVIQLLHSIVRFLLTGRFESDVLLEETHLSFEAIFCESESIFHYSGSFRKMDDVNSPFLMIENEFLRKTTFKQSYRKNLSNIYFLKENLIKPSIGGDTSEVRSFVTSDASVWPDVLSHDDKTIASLINASFDVFGKDVFGKVIQLFDDSVEYIKPFAESGEKNGFLFKRINKPERIATYDYIARTLSAGTFRGITLFLSSLLAFRRGGTVFVDEIEKSFNRNLVQNLILLFNDATINIAHATLVYTTHYAELLDDNDRTDNINVLHREVDRISIKNLCTDYEVRTTISKSNQFNQNAFDNLANYDRLMSLRRALRE